MAIDGRISQVEPRRIKFFERPVRRVADGQARQQYAPFGVQATVRHVEFSFIVLYLRSPECPGAEMPGRFAKQRPPVFPRHEVFRGIVIETAVSGRGSGHVIGTFVFVYERVGDLQHFSVGRPYRIRVRVFFGFRISGAAVRSRRQ